MNSVLNMSPDCGALTTDKASPVVARELESRKTVTDENGATWMQPGVWFTRLVLEVIMGALMLFYLFGAVALSGALLFYTFSIQHP
jgi:hypothetical protein